MEELIDSTSGVPILCSIAIRFPKTQSQILASAYLLVVDKIPSNSREITLEPHAAMLDSSQEENLVFAPSPCSRITKPAHKHCKSFNGETAFVCLPT